MVLTEVRRRTAVIHDPARGRSTMTFAEVSKHFTGVALELTPTSDFERKEETRRIGLRELVGRVPGIGRGLFQLLLLGAAIEVFAVVAPLMMQLIDRSGRRCPGSRSADAARRGLHDAHAGACGRVGAAHVGGALSWARLSTCT